MIWKIRDRILDCQKTLLMGILNITPNSFSDGGQFNTSKKAQAQAIQLIQDGADIVDLGAESTKPGAQPVSAEEELARILPVLDYLIERESTPISIDTTKPAVAQVCLERGAHIINDVSGLKDSGAAMAELVSQHGAGIVLMHRRGTPQTMQSLTQYDEVTREVMRELESSVDMALHAGISRNQIVIDPGIGFAKTAEQNLQILSELEQFQSLKLPVLLGASRKSFIGKVIDRDVQEREFANAAVAAIGVMKGIHILRVHEIGAMRDAVRTAEAIKGAGNVRAFQMGID